MARARVNLEDLSYVKQTINEAKNTALSTVNDLESSVKDSISQIESAFQQVQAVLDACNRSLSQLQRMSNGAAKDLNYLQKQLERTPRKIEEEVIGYDGEPKIVEKDNPIYLQLQHKISVLRSQISEYDRIIRKFNLLKNECMKQRDTLSSAKSKSNAICDRLNNANRNYTAKCETATKVLSNAERAVESYLSVKLLETGSSHSGISSSGSHSEVEKKPSKLYTLWVFAKNTYHKFKTPIQKTFTIVSVITKFITPISSPYQNYQERAIAQQQTYLEYDMRKKTKKARDEIKLAVNYNAIPQTAEPLPPGEEVIKFGEPLNGQILDYAIQTDPTTDSKYQAPRNTLSKANGNDDSNVSSEAQLPKQTHSEKSGNQSSSKKSSNVKKAIEFSAVLLTAISSANPQPPANQPPNSIVSETVETSSFINKGDNKTYTYGYEVSLDTKEEDPPQERTTLNEAIVKISHLVSEILEEHFDPLEAEIEAEKKRREKEQESKRLRHEDEMAKKRKRQQTENQQQQEKQRKTNATIVLNKNSHKSNKPTTSRRNKP